MQKLLQGLRFDNNRVKFFPKGPIIKVGARTIVNTAIQVGVHRRGANLVNIVKCH
jgi:hypothetical protein